MESANTQQQNVVCSLYSLLESAKLSDYYERFLAQGGDDIDQLCEASEYEFKEITNWSGCIQNHCIFEDYRKLCLNFGLRNRNQERVNPILVPLVMDRNMGE